MSNERETQKEIRQILRLLEETAHIIETSSITDQFSDGEERCAKQFNNALTLLAELEAIPEGLFEPLETDASFGDICFACHQVAAYVKESNVEDFVDVAHIKQKMKDAGEIVRQSIPAFLKDLDEHMIPAFLKDAWREETEADTADAAESVEVTSDEDEETPSVEERIAKLEGQMETVVEILQEIRNQQTERSNGPTVSIL